MIGLITKFLAGTLGRVLLGALAIGGTWLAIKIYYEGRGADKERAKIVEAGKKNVLKSKAARRKVHSIPDSQLRDRYYRD